LATDIRLNDWLDRYLMAKQLYERTQDPAVQKDIFEGLGLYQQPELHLGLERVFGQWKIQAQKKD
jgi:hypothetical protein